MQKNLIRTIVLLTVVVAAIGVSGHTKAHLVTQAIVVGAQLALVAVLMCRFPPGKKEGP